MSPLLETPTVPAMKPAVTVAAFEQMSLEHPVELVQGRIVEMHPGGMAHGRVCGNIFFLLELWSRAGGKGIPATNDASVLISQELDTVRGADVLVVSRDALPGGVSPQKSLTVPPDLVVEVLSPSDRWSHIEEKLEDYNSIHVKQVWVVSPEDRCVWICQPDGRRHRLSESDELTSPDVLPGFTCRVAEFFLHV